MNDEMVWMKVNVSEIVWDCTIEEEEQNELPESVILSVEVSIDAGNDEIAEAIESEFYCLYGFKTKGFNWEEEED